MRSINRLVLLGVFFLLVTPVIAVNTETHGYIGIDSVNISLLPGYADVHVNYTIDDAFRVIMLVFGENDARNKLKNLLSFKNASIERMDFESADLKVYDVQKIYGDGLYWFPEHKFNTVIPYFTICNCNNCSSYENITGLENGIVYY